MPLREKPPWWDWPFDFGLPHLAKRLADRGLSEPDLRLLLNEATSVEENHEPGRWILRTRRHAGSNWEVVVEPLYDERVVLVITVYRVNS